jgi:cytidine deaminase
MSPDAPIDAMVAAAFAARHYAHVPYCRFPVGACLKAEGPELFVGVNVENPVPSMSLCAETSALAAMIASGARRLSHVLIVSGNEELCQPCGGCRQRLMPFADSTTMVHLCTASGYRESISFSKILPYLT